MPYFSIVIPSFNRAHIINRVIKGILEQSFQDFEILIIDDGSTDTTKNSIKEYSNDIRIKYHYQNNAGVCAARNTGAKLVKGAFLIFLDSDDTVEKSWLQDFHDSLVNQNYDIAYCNITVLKSDGSTKKINAANPYGNNTGKGADMAGSWAIKKELFLKIGMYDTQIKFGENSELRLRLEFEKPRVVLVDKYNFNYYTSPDGGSKNNQNKMDSILYTLDKHKAHYDKSIRVKKLYLQNAAVAAVRIGQVKKAHELFAMALIDHKKDTKLWLQYFLTLNKYLAKTKWR
jgi:glycosyltransferase involved in cell wall biosynthesis